jgi:hypothetical protein
MPRGRIAGLSLAFLATAVSCQRQPPTQPTSRPVIQAATAESPIAEKIRALIEKLAISDEAASTSPPMTPPADTPKDDKRMIAYAAASDLEKFGIEAFPFLLASLEDKRQSVAFRRVQNFSVGEACFNIMAWQIYSLPKSYRGSFYRTGVDGELHERPVFSKSLFGESTIQQWLNARSNRSLAQLQSEALRWELAEEEKIGYRTPEEEAEYIAPLREQLAAISK